MKNRFYFISTAPLVLILFIAILGAFEAHQVHQMPSTTRIPKPEKSLTDQELLDLSTTLAAAEGNIP